MNKLILKLYLHRAAADYIYIEICSYLEQRADYYVVSMLSNTRQLLSLDWI